MSYVVEEIQPDGSKKIVKYFSKNLKNSADKFAVRCAMSADKGVIYTVREIK